MRRKLFTSSNSSLSALGDYDKKTHLTNLKKHSPKIFVQTIWFKKNLMKCVFLYNILVAVFVEALHITFPYSFHSQYEVMFLQRPHLVVELCLFLEGVMTSA